MLTTWFSTQVLPSIISAASGAIAGVVIAGWDKLSAKFLLSKLGPSVKTVYNIIDPILDGSLQGWKDSDIDRALGLAIEVAYDGKLTPDEINRIVRLISQRWVPQIASDKIAKGLIGEKERAVAERIRSAVDAKSINAPETLLLLKKLYVG
jgi:hypothetical protein